MREIKFRVWNGDEMEESTLSFNFEDGQTKKEMHIYPEDIFMQYTGLKDKNGVEIYEGDIVKADCRNGHNEDSGRYSIEYDNTNTCFFGSPNKCRQDIGMILNVIHNQPMSELRQNIEVIGNIYENPELLEAR